MINHGEGIVHPQTGDWSMVSSVGYVFERSSVIHGLLKEIS